MGGKKKGGFLSDIGLGSNTLVGGAINAGVKGASGGSFSTDGTGYLENGNPLKGDTFVRGVTGAATAGVSDSQYYAPKDMGEKLAKEAKQVAKTNQDKLLGAAKQREADEAVTKDAQDTINRAKALQDRRSRGKGRASTIMSGTGESQTLGNAGAGKSILGI